MWQGVSHPDLHPKDRPCGWRLQGGPRSGRPSSPRARPFVKSARDAHACASDIDTSTAGVGTDVRRCRWRRCEHAGKTTRWMRQTAELAYLQGFITARTRGLEPPRGFPDRPEGAWIARCLPPCPPCPNRPGCGTQLGGRRGSACPVESGISRNLAEAFARGSAMIRRRWRTASSGASWAPSTPTRGSGGRPCDQPRWPPSRGSRPRAGSGWP